MYVGVLGKGRKVGIPMNVKGVGVLEEITIMMILQMKVKKSKGIA